ncbi:MAG: glycerol kinase GlpK [Caldilineaceae bacterium]|nr:glycerol kinase GlpK [Caldilineaceae bacterium]
MAYWLGIDQGTSQTTAVVVDEQGRVQARRTVKLAAHFPKPGWVEQDPWEILAGVRAAAAPLLDAYPIQTVGFDNQGETFLLWDAATGAPVTPAIVWQDQRGLALCRQLAHEIDARLLQTKTGLRLDSYFSAPKLRFVLEQDHSLATAAQAGKLRFGTMDTWVLWHLSQGRLHITDPSTASRTLLFDINRLAWDDELLGWFRVPHALLPTVIASSGFVAELDWGDGHLRPLHALLVDQQAALFGQACFAPGDVKCTFGTGAFLLMNTGSAVHLSGHGLLATIAWHIDGATTYALDGGDFATGAAVQWLADGLALIPDVAASGTLAESSHDLAVVFVPALAGLAAPYWLPQARGAFFGLQRSTSRADLARAVLDGIACRVHELVETMQRDSGNTLRQLKVDGGPSANRYLMQSLADLLDIEILVAANDEATAAGIAQLAGHAASGVSLASLRAGWRPQAAYSPRVSPAERQARLDRWHRALAAVRLFHAETG